LIQKQKDLNIIEQEVFKMTPTVMVIGTYIAKICVLGATSITILTGVKWFNDFNPSFKKKNGKEGKVNDDIDNTIESLRQKAGSRA
jgi:hypothetical protein